MSEKTPPELSDVPLTLSVVRSPDDLAPARHQPDAVAHLANERTFLAWSFTAIAFIGSGVALARTLIALNSSPLSSARGGIVSSLLYPTTMGLLFLGAGVGVLVMATCRYLSVQKQLMEQRFQPSGTLALVLLGIVLALSILLAGFLLHLRGTL